MARDENFLSMIKNPPEVGAVRIHMDPESLDTSFRCLTANTCQGVAKAGPFKMEGTRWHLLSKVFSSPDDIKTDLYIENSSKKPWTKIPNVDILLGRFSDRPS